MNKIYEGVTILSEVEWGENITVFPGAVIGRPPLSSGATTRQKDAATLPPVRLGDNCIIGAHAVIYAGVTIGEKTMIGDNACIREECTIGRSTVIGTGVKVSFGTQIGSFVKIIDNAYITGNMIIEDRVFIGPHVTTANDNAMERFPELKEKDWRGKGPTIRHFATIGQGACLLPEIEIGENALVGAGSVVTKDVPPKTVVMGVPARIIRQLREDEIKK